MPPDGRGRPVAGAAPKHSAVGASTSVPTEQPGKATEDAITPHCCLDTSDAAFMAGFDLGYARGRQHASEDMARALLAEQAQVMQVSAVRLARQHHGAAWAEAIREQAEGVA
jgi:hypothetical protein